jgi:large subunit ribosomal protein L18
MITKTEKSKKKRVARKFRIRKKISGIPARPRITVSLSNRFITAQVIDDTTGKTLAAVSSGESSAGATGKNRAAAKWVGETIAERTQKLGITSAVFDRNGYLYHGRVKDLADAIRSKGITV